MSVYGRWHRAAARERYIRKRAEYEAEKSKPITMRQRFISLVCGVRQPLPPQTMYTDDAYVKGAGCMRQSSHPHATRCSASYYGSKCNTCHQLAEHAEKTNKLQKIAIKCVLLCK